MNVATTATAATKLVATITQALSYWDTIPRHLCHSPHTGQVPTLPPDGRTHGPDANENQYLPGRWCRGDRSPQSYLSKKILKVARCIRIYLRWESHDVDYFARALQTTNKQPLRAISRCK